MKKIAFLMATPFTYGGEQRVVTKVANLFCDEGYDVSIICIFKHEINYEIYNLDKKIKIEDASSKNFFSRVFLKINNKIRNINSSTKLLANFPEIIKKLIFSSTIRKKIINIINKNEYDYIVGVGSDFSIFLSSYKKEFNKNIKIIGWQHNTFDAYFNKKGRRLYGEHKLFKKYVNNFDKYITLMQQDKQDMDNYFNMNCTKIFNPLSFENVSQISKLNKDQFIWFGRFEHVKGVDLLIEAYEIYKKLGGKWKLQIIGDGLEKEKVIKLVNQKNLTNDIEFIGFTNTIQDYLKDSTIFLFPSRWEGFGLTLTESMQYGLPCICFDLNAFIEISEGYQSCCFVPQFDVQIFAEKMFELSNNKEKIKFMSKEALENIKKFEGKKIIKEWIEMINNKN